MRHVVITRNVDSGKLDVRLDFTTSHDEVLSQSSIGDDTELLVCSKSFEDIFKESVGETDDLSITLINTLIELGDSGHEFEDALRTLMIATLRKGVAIGKAENMINNA